MGKLKLIRVISVLLVMILCLSVIPVTGLAADKTDAKDKKTVTDKADATDTAEEIQLDNFQKANSYNDDTFSHVKPDDWFYENVKTVYELGLMVGKRANRFDHASGVTIAKTLAIAARLHSFYHNRKADFEQPTPWYKVYTDYITENGIAGISSMDLNVPATRAQFVQIIANALLAPKCLFMRWIIKNV
ncbi:MAG TPA: hypothetical protein GXX36_02680 [Clostridiaceae bacterium]|nr:hypothetical protein [Clostridiaceae bacterium]